MERVFNEQLQVNWSFQGLRIYQALTTLVLLECFLDSDFKVLGYGLRAKFRFHRLVQETLFMKSVGVKIWIGRTRIFISLRLSCKWAQYLHLKAMRICCLMSFKQVLHLWAFDKILWLILLEICLISTFQKLWEVNFEEEILLILLPLLHNIQVKILLQLIDSLRLQLKVYPLFWWTQEHSLNVHYVHLQSTRQALLLEVRKFCLHEACLSSSQDSRILLKVLIFQAKEQKSHLEAQPDASIHLIFWYTGRITWLKCQ